MTAPDPVMCRACMCKPHREATHIDPESGDPICDTCAYVGTCRLCLQPGAEVTGVAFGQPACELCIACERDLRLAHARARRAA